MRTRSTFPRGSKFDGTLCEIDGHGTLRYRSNGVCVACLAAKQPLTEQWKKRQTKIRRAYKEYESW